MVSHHCIYQLVLCVLSWLFVVLHLTRPSPGVCVPVTPAEPDSLNRSVARMYVSSTRQLIHIGRFRR
jgi:hypothetical protein